MVALASAVSAENQLTKVKEHISFDDLVDLVNTVKGNKPMIDGYHEACLRYDQLLTDCPPVPDRSVKSDGFWRNGSPYLARMARFWFFFDKEKIYIATDYPAQILLSYYGSKIYVMLKHRWSMSHADTYDKMQLLYKQGPLFEKHGGIAIYTMPKPSWYPEWEENIVGHKKSKSPVYEKYKTMTRSVVEQIVQELKEAEEFHLDSYRHKDDVPEIRTMEAIDSYMRSKGLDCLKPDFENHNVRAGLAEKIAQRRYSGVIGDRIDSPWIVWDYCCDEGLTYIYKHPPKVDVIFSWDEIRKFRSR